MTDSRHDNPFVPTCLRSFCDRVRRFFSIRKARRKKKVKFYVSRESGRPLSDIEYNTHKVSEQARIDRILDKISKNGYGALSAEEKDFLFYYSKKA